MKSCIEFEIRVECGWRHPDFASRIIDPYWCRIVEVGPLKPKNITFQFRKKCTCCTKYRLEFVMRTAISLDNKLQQSFTPVSNFITGNFHWSTFCTDVITTWRVCAYCVAGFYLQWLLRHLLVYGMRPLPDGPWDGLTWHQHLLNLSAWHHGGLARHVQCVLFW